MKPSDATLEHMKGLPEPDVANWIAESFLEFVQQEDKPQDSSLNRPRDPFAPHAWVHLLAQTPAKAIRNLYAWASIDLQASIHRGVDKLSALCRADNLRTRMLSQTQRLCLLELCLELVAGTVCLRATRTLGRIASQDQAAWEPDLFSCTVFPECLIALEDLALAFDASSHRSDASASEVTAALYQMVSCDAFRSEYSPRLLAALVAVNPTGLLNHLQLLGPEVSKMHTKDIRQWEMAHLTAERIVKSGGLHRLQQIFPQLQIAPAERDHWLFVALFGEKGPLQGVSIGHENVVLVFIGGNMNRQMEFHHPRAMATLHETFPDSRPPPPDSEHPVGVLLQKARKGQSGFYKGSKIDFKSPPPRTPAVALAPALVDWRASDSQAASDPRIH